METATVGVSGATSLSVQQKIISHSPGEYTFMNTKRTIEKQVAKMEDFLDLRNINKFPNSSYRI